MIKRIALIFAFLPAFLLFGSALAALTGSSPEAPNDAATLAALIRAPSFREADKLAAKLLADPVLDAPTMALCGLAVLKAGRIAEAEAIFAKVIARSPDSPDAHLGLGRIARIRNDEDAAIAHLRRAVPSVEFFEEALRQLWRAAWARGFVSDLAEIRELAEERYRLASLPLPSWLEQQPGPDRRARRESVSSIWRGASSASGSRSSRPRPASRIRMIALKLNGKADRLFHIDSAVADFMTISPLLAEELGLVADRQRLVHRRRHGRRRDPLRRAGQGRARRDRLPQRAGHGLRRPDAPGTERRPPRNGLSQALQRHDRRRGQGHGPLPARPARASRRQHRPHRRGGGRTALLLRRDDRRGHGSRGRRPRSTSWTRRRPRTSWTGPSSRTHVKPKLDPARIVRAGIRGAGGPQTVNQVEGLAVRLGPLVLGGLQFNEFSMETLNTIPGRYTAGFWAIPCSGPTASTWISGTAASSWRDTPARGAADRRGSGMRTARPSMKTRTTRVR